MIVAEAESRRGSGELLHEVPDGTRVDAWVILLMDLV